VDLRATRRERLLDVLVAKLVLSDKKGPARQNDDGVYRRSL
jgi:hypothetical protein